MARKFIYGEPTIPVTNKIPTSKVDAFKAMAAEWLKQFEVGDDSKPKEAPAPKMSKFAKKMDELIDNAAAEKERPKELAEGEFFPKPKETPRELKRLEENVYLCEGDKFKLKIYGNVDRFFHTRQATIDARDIIKRA